MHAESFALAQDNYSGPSFRRESAKYLAAGALLAVKVAEFAVVLQAAKRKRVDQAQVIRPIAFSIRQIASDSCRLIKRVYRLGTSL
jgi:hypothetical protein